MFGDIPTAHVTCQLDVGEDKINSGSDTRQGGSCLGSASLDDLPACNSKRFRDDLADATRVQQ